MIERIVRMSFETASITDFLHVFERSKAAIAAFPGCKGLRLLKDLHHDHVFLTYSYWDSEDDLNAYRNSELFKTTWAQTKILFNQKPIAWSVHTIDTVK
ncbi:MAG: antibiotic biosynthesis monooxygenase family protein [Bacteroidia bacterium]|jgi:hypothetical protein